jgi:hypothetical protein
MAVNVETVTAGSEALPRARWYIRHPSQSSASNSTAQEVPRQVPYADRPVHRSGYVRAWGCGYSWLGEVEDIVSLTVECDHEFRMLSANAMQSHVSV